MRRALIALTILALPSLSVAQTPPEQITNKDLLQLIGLQQVQNLQCGKALEAVQQEVATLKSVKDTRGIEAPKAQ